MALLVGLGNPGPAYAKHRHNVGFMAVDAIVRRHGFAPWRARFEGVTSEGQIGTSKVVALKPHTYMNDSGRSVQAAARFYKLEPDRVFVFYDELDLLPGKVRVKRGGGSGGHNGIRSLDAHLGPEYWRVRMGIGHPGHKDLVSGYVLHDFAKADAAWLDLVLDAIAAEVPRLVAGDEAGFMSRVAHAVNPPLPKAEKVIKD
ncbi:MAG TPA: aminoacyl-tRNA hydrolase [Alphaproteobacteria bacterium]|nr:aminoacyl-tRNA hydrolase [Alphaproteobacteria bacterium]